MKKNTIVLKPGDSVNFIHGGQRFQGKVLKTDLKSEKPFLLILVDHNAPTYREFAIQASPEQVEKTITGEENAGE